MVMTLQFVIFFVFCILELAYVACEPGTLYNDIVWLLNQDTCQLSYKSWILSAPFIKQFQKVIQSGESSGFGEGDVNYL